ncbi:helix-turn-helix transcriptional regulator [Streptomyces sp. NBC_01217]|uniref:helix-turn-helix transcriptional regulator n=1 Tax=Streptomyces sp. NBC_01217 TaxID=2903779 RepID=UPI002E0EC5D6|nr:helix-turn-helix transcriptional regulator [Streptomyces sp. NBC_01217]
MSEIAAQVYAYALDYPSFAPSDVSASLRIDDSSVNSAIRELARMRLVCRAMGGGDLLVAVNPDIAVAQLLFPMERALRIRQEEVEQVRAELEGLAPLYNESIDRRRRLEAVEMLPDLGTVRAMLTQLAASCEKEVLTSQPGGGRSEPVLEEAITRDEELLRRGVAMRILYQHTARFSQPTHSYVERVAPLGAEVRTLADGFVRLIVFDSETAVISLQGVDTGAVLVRDPSIVQFMVSAYERAWSAAAEFPLNIKKYNVEAVSGETKQTIMHLLVEGLDDKNIARRLGMSLRTCQRHVSEIMERIGARSRLQAGYLISKHGWLEAGTPPLTRLPLNATAPPEREPSR